MDYKTIQTHFHEPVVSVPPHPPTKEITECAIWADTVVRVTPPSGVNGRWIYYEYSNGVLDVIWEPMTKAPYKNQS